MKKMTDKQIYKKIREIILEIEYKKLWRKDEDAFTDAMVKIANLAARNADGDVLIDALDRELAVNGIDLDEEYPKHSTIKESDIKILAEHIDQCIWDRRK